MRHVAIAALSFAIPAVFAAQTPAPAGDPAFDVASLLVDHVERPTED